LSVRSFDNFEDRNSYSSHKVKFLLHNRLSKKIPLPESLISQTE